MYQYWPHNTHSRGGSSELPSPTHTPINQKPRHEAWIVWPCTAIITPSKLHQPASCGLRKGLSVRQAPNEKPTTCGIKESHVRFLREFEDISDINFLFFVSKSFVCSRLYSHIVRRHLVKHAFLNSSAVWHHRDIRLYLWFLVIRQRPEAFSTASPLKRPSQVTKIWIV